MLFNGTGNDYSPHYQKIMNYPFWIPILFIHDYPKNEGDGGKKTVLEANHVICTGNTFAWIIYTLIAISYKYFNRLTSVFVNYPPICWVIFSVPLGFLKQNHTKFFSPVLPMQKQSSIREMSFGIVCKIFLQFEKSLAEVSLKIKLI